MKLHTGDTVVVITGKDKGKTGKILRVLSEQGRLVVEGVNMRTRHVRKTRERPGQIIRYEASFHVSNVMLLDSKTKKPARVGYQIKDGKKIRISKRSGDTIEKGVKRTKGAKVIKEEKGATEKDVPKAPTKRPFWKRLGFGADALEEAEVHPTSEDHSVPGDARLQSSRSHGRGS